tara:strand:+ start:12524 stop:13108 length:585 start_codon:yes stop_codon:yes gene_type:complete
MTIEHNDIGVGEIHEPKGITTAPAGSIYVANGANSGAWANIHGWAYYKDNAGAQTFTTSAAKLSIDGLGSTTEIGYLPTGVTALWDTTADKIVADTLGDSYAIRLDLPITAVTGSASILEMELDIGGGATPSVVVVDRQISVAAGASKTVSVSFGIFSLATFMANGAQVFLKADANTVQITAPALLIQRVSKGV